MRDRDPVRHVTVDGSWPAGQRSRLQSPTTSCDETVNGDACRKRPPSSLAASFPTLPPTGRPGKKKMKGKKKKNRPARFSYSLHPLFRVLSNTAPDTSILAELDGRDR